jgi:hypothetical protein
MSFDPSVLVYWRRRIAASDRPDRVSGAVAEVIARGRVRLELAGRAPGRLRLRGAPGASAAVQGHRLGAAEEDKVDAAILAQLLRADLLPEAWIAPAKVRQLRALLRHRISLVRLATQARNRIHAVAADHGYDRSASYWTGPGRG